VQALRPFLPNYFGEIFVKAKLLEVEEKDSKGELRKFNTRDYDYIIPKEFSAVALDSQVLLDAGRDELCVGYATNAPTVPRHVPPILTTSHPTASFGDTEP
jgi:hypothetical protein